MIISIALVISILAGQLIKFPLFGIQGPTLLDFFVFFIGIIGLFKLKFKLKKPSTPITYALLFLTCATTSLILTPLQLNFSQYLLSFSYTLRLFLYLLFSWIIYSDAFPNFRKNISPALIYSGVGLAILGLLQLLLFPNLQFLESLGWDPHYFRTVSTFLDPNFAGAFFVLTLLLIGSNKKTTKLTIVFFVVTYLALLTTFSRSSYLMFLISGLSFGFLHKSKKIVIVTLILFLGLLLSFQIYSQLVAKPRGINREQSASFRLDTWQQGLNIFYRSPLFGIGFNSYKYAVKEYQLSNEGFLNSRGATTNDSSLLYVLSTTGLIGFLTYLLFLLYLVKTSWKNNLVLAAAIIGFIPHSFFANSLFYPFILIWILLIYVIPKK